MKRTAWTLVERAEAALGQPLAHLLLDADADELARTREAQLAVLLTSLVAWEAVRDASRHPVAFAGHSLGQITALIASGALTLEDGVRFAAARADATQAAADARPGRMAALHRRHPRAGPGRLRRHRRPPDEPLLGRQRQRPRPGRASAGRPTGSSRPPPEPPSWRSGGSSPSTSAPPSTPRSWRPPPTDLAPFLAATPFSAPRAPVVSNTDAAPHRGADGWPERLTRHLVSPVRWRESMLTLAALGADMLIEVGPGSVLSGLARVSSRVSRAGTSRLPATCPLSRRSPDMEAGTVHGELLVVPERVILAPAAGKFRPAETGVEPAEGDPVDREQVIGFVDGLGHSTPVRSPFAGRLMGLLASAGERVREGQPVAWLRLAL